MNTDVETVSAYLKLLSDGIRLDMLNRLQEREHCVCDFVDVYGISQPAISRHLKLLRQAHIILERRDRQWIHFRLNPDHSHYALLVTILATLERPSLTEGNMC
ncbi:MULTISPECIES: metalloregulator ArsR/SmtB family transcription factor [unclassified Exiguobacterium]|uniref:ArsR/SmtB family transcription factor n=1 Tax=unclassified Exiguobacterium TaxID=2644629 RepID=UPI001BE61FB8|nr:MULTISPECIES: metalloregulator ArsR/SmtB family transcription factor [unclassified Exiguobacterium]